MDTIHHGLNIEVDADAVWQVITDPTHMKEWYFDIPDFSPDVGSFHEWWAGAPGERLWHHRITIDAVDVGKHLSYFWEYPGYEGKALCSWHLEQQSEDKTALHFTFDFLIPFQSDQPELSMKRFEDGWRYLILTSLPDYLRRL